MFDDAELLIEEVGDRATSMPGPSSPYEGSLRDGQDFARWRPGDEERIDTRARRPRTTTHPTRAFSPTLSIPSNPSIPSSPRAIQRAAPLASTTTTTPSSARASLSPSSAPSPSRSRPSPRTRSHVEDEVRQHHGPAESARPGPSRRHHALLSELTARCLSAPPPLSSSL